MIIRIGVVGAPHATLRALLAVCLRGKPAPTKPTMLTTTPFEGSYYAEIENPAAAELFLKGLGQLHDVDFEEITQMPGRVKIAPARSSELTFEELFREVFSSAGRQPGSGPTIIFKY